MMQCAALLWNWITRNGLHTELFYRTYLQWNQKPTCIGENICDWVSSSGSDNSWLLLNQVLWCDYLSITWYDGRLLLHNRVARCIHCCNCCFSATLLHRKHIQFENWGLFKEIWRRASLLAFERSKCIILID